MEDLSHDCDGPLVMTLLSSYTVSVSVLLTAGAAVEYLFGCCWVKHVKLLEGRTCQLVLSCGQVVEIQSEQLLCLHRGR